MVENIKLLYIDLFCGAGGTSTGVERARDWTGRKCAKVIACVNHDANAIASHAANHPDALHITEDIRTLELSPMVDHLAICRRRFPSAKVVLWASLECTNFSRAKGGQPRDADSRTLAEHLFRYIEALTPDYIQIENVEEFMSWGDLDADGHPISKDSGRLYRRWVENVMGYGYAYEYRMLNAADFGAFTSRRRFFGMFAKGGLPIVFPTPTHSRDGHPGTKKWRAVKEVLDFDDEGTNIFERKRPLSEATLERLYAGLIKFVAGGKEAFLVKYNSMSRNRRYNAPGVEEPCPTVTTQNRLGVAMVAFLSKQFSGDPGSKNISVDSPSGAITTIDHHAYISAYYGKGFNTSVDGPAPTVTTKDRLSIVRAHFMDQQYGTGRPASVEKPANTVTTNPKFNLVTCRSFLMNPYSFKSDGCSVEKPCCTLIARMDKMPLYLATTEAGEAYIKVFTTDSPMTAKIKEFMAMYGIVAVKMRMLKIPELLRIMGFGDGYVLKGTQGEQKKYIGNAVCPEVPTAWCAEIVHALHCHECKIELEWEENECMLREVYGPRTAGCLLRGELI